MEASDGRTIPFEKGVLHVLENRLAKDSRVIQIRFARLKATRPTKAPPIVFLPGGPDYSMLDGFSSMHENSWY